MTYPRSGDKPAAKSLVQPGTKRAASRTEGMESPQGLALQNNLGLSCRPGLWHIAALLSASEGTQKVFQFDQRTKDKPLGMGGRSSFSQRPGIAAAQCPRVTFTPSQAPAPSLEAPRCLLGLSGSPLDQFAEESLCILCIQVEKRSPALGRAGALEMKSNMRHQP